MRAPIGPLAVFGRDQLRENRSGVRGLGGPADVVLTGRRGFGVNDEFFGLGVLGRGRLQRLHVAAVTRLGHRETLLTFQHQWVLARGSVQPSSVMLTSLAAPFAAPDAG